jgi:hypothetical protein
VAKLTDLAVPLRPTARRVLRALREDGPQRIDQLAARLAANGRPIQSATIVVALQELHAAGLAAVDVEHQDEPTGHSSATPVERDPGDGCPGCRCDPATTDSRAPSGRASLENYPNRSGLRVF